MESRKLKWRYGMGERGKQRKEGIGVGEEEERGGAWGRRRGKRRRTRMKKELGSPRKYKEPF